jgi:AICAR transformylase/IMP cyclohydrolase PurH
MDYGIEIYLGQLNAISIAKDKQSATIGGGINSKVVTDTLWAAGKQTGKPTVLQKVPSLP